VILHGRYEVTRNGDRIGDERFHFLERAVESQAALSWPEASERKLRIARDGAGDPVELELSCRAGGETLRGRYRIDRDAGTLRALVQPEAGASIERVAPFRSDAELEYLSPIAWFMTVRRLRLWPGEVREYDALAVDPATLLPRPTRRRIRRLPDVELGPILAAEYLGEGDPRGFELRLQTNVLGLPVRLWVHEGDATGEFTLVE
jgi:hypothetical protein